ncbi:hypothetical protein [Novipirellula caenicola]
MSEIPVSRFHRWSIAFVSLQAMLICLLSLGQVEVHSAESTAFATPIHSTQLDRDAFTQWAEGRESAIPMEAAKNGPSDILWTSDKRPDWRGVQFGTNRAPGPRHLRIAFTESIGIGTLLVRGGATLSVLKPDAPYPGDLGNETHWQSADRLSPERPHSREDYDVWTLPADTKTRAIRFTHVAEAADQNPAGWLGGAWVLSDRFANLAPQSILTATARPEAAERLNDQSNNRQWHPWDNGESGAALRVSPDHPEIITMVWPRAVKLEGLCLLWAEFSTVEVDAFAGSPETAIRSAAETDWRKVAASDTIDPYYPMGLGANWIGFDQEIETRAIRLRITGGSTATHSHLVNKIKDGRGVWLGEIVALTSLHTAPLTSVDLPAIREEIPPPIPVKFTLAEPSVVTLVIEDEQGRRVRNLVSETEFPAGENVVWWDGSDDLLRDPEAAQHGLYHLPTRFVSPGTYTVRGLTRKPLELTYEQSVYSAGHPAWETADKTGCWMTNYTPPTSIACVPGRRTRDGQPLVFMGAFVAEGGHGLQWLAEDGTKIGGQGWVGGNWTGATTLTVDLGPRAVADHLCYIASIWEGELRITAKSRDFQDKPILKLQLGDDPRPDKRPRGTQPLPRLVNFDGGDRKFVLAGIAAHDGVIACSLIRQNEIRFIETASGKTIRTQSIENPRGLAYDQQGRLLALSGTKLVRFGKQDSPAETIIATGLDDPRHIALDDEANYYISDQGHSHQVKVFSPDGRLLRTLGKSGEPKTGLYDPLHMNHPNGLGIDSQGRLWVAENDFHPKRVSLWSPQSELLRAFYGPGEYGGGGVLDPHDKTRFFYKGQEFHLNWQSGTDTLVRVFYRPSPLMEAHYGPYSPDTPLYPDARRGERYFTSCFTHNPTNGDGVSFVWRDAGATVDLVAAVGNAHAWPILKTEPFDECWPEGADPQGDENRNPAAFAWSDANGDGLPQPSEVQISQISCSGVTTQSDLSMVVARWGNQTVQFFPVKFNEHGAPLYDLAAPQVLLTGSQRPQSSGGDQALTEPGGWTIHTVAPAPFSPYGLGGSLGGQARWTYPNVWPGLHASHEAAIPGQPGMVIGTTRLLGGWIRPGGDAGSIFAINGNMGNMYLFTADGLFVATLFHDIRLRPNWAMPQAVRGMDVSNVSLHDENFWPSITQTVDGKIFVVDGGRVSLVRVSGLDSIRRISAQPLTVTTDDLAKAREWFVQTEATRQAVLGSGTLKVTLRSTAPQVDGRLEDWSPTTDWAPIDRRGTKANFNSDSRPYDASAAVTIVGDQLFAAWRTNEKDLLTNSGETPQALFKTGGALDIMLGTDLAAKADRAEPAPGDLRLLVTQVKGKTRALLYRASVPGTQQPVAFSSPWRTIYLDSVQDVSDKLKLASDGSGNYEVQVPLSVLEWQPTLGETYHADLGVLRGNGGQTNQRVYWSNKATAITADVPSEAELTPKLWGRWEVVGE